MSSSILKVTDENNSRIKSITKLPVIQRYHGRPSKKAAFLQIISKEKSKNSKEVQQFNKIQNNPQNQIIPVQIKKQSLLQENKQLNSVKKTIPCEICLQQVMPQKLISLMGCSHKFCQTCTKLHFQNRLSSKLPVYCPYNLCENKLVFGSQHYKQLTIEQQIKFVKSEQHKKYLQTGENRLCPKPDCLGYMKRNKCEFCSEKSCYACMGLYHEGQCDQKAMKRMKGRFGYKKCNRCSMFVQKSYGCNHMTCMCGHEFCYSCGKDWQNHNSCEAQDMPANLTFMEYIYWEIINRRDEVQFFYHSPSPILSLVEKYVYNRKEDAFSLPFLILYFIFIYPLILLGCLLLLIYSFFIVHIFVFIGCLLLSSCIYYQFTRLFSRKYRKILWAVWIILLPISIIITGILSFVLFWIAGYGQQTYFYKLFLVKQFKGIYSLLLSVCMIYNTDGFQFA